MRSRYSLRGLALVLVVAPFAGAAWPVPLDLNVTTPAARASTCRVSLAGTPSFQVASYGRHDGRLKITNISREITVIVGRTRGDRPDVENLRVKFELNRQVLVNALSPYLEGITGEAFRFVGQPNYPLLGTGRTFPPTSLNNNAALEWLVRMDVGTNPSSEIGLTLDEGAIVRNAGKLKFLDTNSVNVTVPDAYTITCSVERRPEE